MTAGVTSATATTDLLVGGMTCAACAHHVEKRLARLDGVSASVNLATGRARVSHPPHTTARDLLAAVGRAGYAAELLLPPRPLTPPRPVVPPRPAYPR